eukprot:gene11197-biopygen7202
MRASRVERDALGGLVLRPSIHHHGPIAERAVNDSCVWAGVTKVIFGGLEPRASQYLPAHVPPSAFDTDFANW